MAEAVEARPGRAVGHDFGPCAGWAMKAPTAATIAVSVLLASAACPAYGQMTPKQAILSMTRGFNLGRCLEVPDRVDRIQQYYFDDITIAGFNFVRLPIQWDPHTATNSPYTVDSTWLDRVEQVVDWGLAQGLTLIINSHHDYWILENPNFTAGDLARFKAIWAQTSYRLRNKSERLLFEIANEPNGLSTSQINQINASVIPVIRSNNPTRIIIYSGKGSTSLPDLQAAAIPSDEYIMGTFHSYDPWDFAGLGNGTWGTIAEKQAVTNRFQNARAWSQQHNIPLLLGEYGTVNSIDRPSREAYLANVVAEASRNGVAPCIWSDFGDFAIYYPGNPVASRWSYVKDIIMTNSQPGALNTVTTAPPVIVAFSVQSNRVDLTWTSNTGRLYTVECSLTLISWSTLAADIPAASGTNRTSAAFDLTVGSVSTNQVLVLYQMAQLGPQTQDAVNGIAGGNLTSGAGLSTFNPNSTQAYPTAPSLAVTFSATSTNLTDSLANQAWFTFTLTVGSGVSELGLSRLAFNAARGGTSTPRGYAVYVTTPTTTNELVRGATDLTTQRFDWGPQQTIDLTTLSSLQNLEPRQVVTFKIPVYSPSTGSSLDFDNITVNGKVFAGNVAPYAGAKQFFLRVREQ
jgi:hypothetical protein